MRFYTIIVFSVLFFSSSITSVSYAQTAADLKQIDRLVETIMVSDAYLNKAFGDEETPRVDLVRETAKRRRLANEDRGELGCHIYHRNNGGGTEMGMLCPAATNNLDKAVDTVSVLLTTPTGNKAYQRFGREFDRKQAAELLKLAQRKTHKKIGSMPTLTAWAEGKTKAITTVASSH